VLRRIILFLAVALMGGAATAADPKPDFAIKTKIADIAVLLDNGIKADPPLAMNSLADGKRWAAKQQADAQQAYKQDRDAFSNQAWSYERSYTLRSIVANRYVSVVMTDDTFTGGAHPNTDIDTVLWDRTAKKRISIRPFFTDLTDNSSALKQMSSGIIASLIDAKKKRGTYQADDLTWKDGIEPKLLKIGAVTLAPSTDASKSSGLTFHYPPDAVGAHAEGGYSAFVPWQQLKPYLTPEGIAIFGGARPQDDDDNLDRPQE
jgi:hypothetical protein